MSGTENLPLTRLVFVIISLAVAASILAGVLYVFMEQPAVNAIQLPENRDESCALKCIDQMYECMRTLPSDHCIQIARECEAQCPHYPPR